MHRWILHCVLCLMMRMAFFYVISNDMFYPWILQFSWEIVALLCNLIGESRDRRAAICL